MNSSGEWSPLREVLLGSGPAHHTRDIDLSVKLLFHDVARSRLRRPCHGSAGHADPPAQPAASAVMAR